MAEGMMSPSDVAVMMSGKNNEDGCWGSGMGFMWIFALLILANGGFGGWGGNNAATAAALGYENLATSNEVQRGFDAQNSMANEREILAAVNSNALQGMQNANQNTQYMMNAFSDKYNELQRDISGVNLLQQQAIANQNDCCCSTKMLIQENAAGINAGIAQNRYEAAMNLANVNAGIAQNRYEAAMNTAGIIQAIQQDGAATRNMIQENKIESLQQKVNDLNLQVQMAGVARMPLTATYNAGPYPFCGCNNNCCGM